MTDDVARAGERDLGRDANRTGGPGRNANRGGDAARTVDTARTVDAARTVELPITVQSEAELDALEQALLRARASELAEVRRRQVRLSAGYGDTVTRASMGDESARAELRHAMLDRLIEALRSSR